MMNSSLSSIVNDSNDLQMDALPLQLTLAHAGGDVQSAMVFDMFNRSKQLRAHSKQNGIAGKIHIVRAIKVSDVLFFADADDADVAGNAIVQLHRDGFSKPTTNPTTDTSTFIDMSREQREGTLVYEHLSGFGVTTVDDVLGSLSGGAYIYEELVSPIYMVEPYLGKLKVQARVSLPATLTVKMVVYVYYNVHTIEGKVYQRLLDRYTGAYGGMSRSRPRS